MPTHLRLWLAAASLLLVGAAAHAQPFDGCPSPPIEAAFIESAKSGRPVKIEA